MLPPFGLLESPLTPVRSDCVNRHTDQRHHDMIYMICSNIYVGLPSAFSLWSVLQQGASRLWHWKGLEMHFMFWSMFGGNMVINAGGSAFDLWQATWAGTTFSNRCVRKWTNQWPLKREILVLSEPLVPPNRSLWPNHDCHYTWLVAQMRDQVKH